MKYLKKFENFEMADPTVKPATKPVTRPNVRPQRPSPIRRDRPAVTPAPKAEKELPKATIEDVIEKFAKLTNQK
jgi:hypothetical protein